MSKAKTRRSGPEPTFPRISYGPDPLNYMTVWLAESSQPSPVVVQFYAGAFKVGEANRKRSDRLLAQASAGESDLPILQAKQEILKLLSSGISIVAPAHRRPDLDPAPAPFEDAARVVQFVRSKAPEWNLDPDRVAATGASSGACLSLWLGCHPDQADPPSTDPIRRASTRLACVAVSSALTSIDPRFIRELLPGSSEYRRHGQLLDFDPDELDRLPAAKYELMERLSPINHVTQDSPPALLRYDLGMNAPLGKHHPAFGLAFKEKMDAAGARCDLVAGGKPILGSRKVTIPTFLKEHLLG